MFKKIYTIYLLSFCAIACPYSKRSVSQFCENIDNLDCISENINQEEVIWHNRTLYAKKLMKFTLRKYTFSKKRFLHSKSVRAAILNRNYVFCVMSDY